MHMIIVVVVFSVRRFVRDYLEECHLLSLSAPVVYLPSDLLCEHTIIFGTPRNLVFRTAKQRTKNHVSADSTAGVFPSVVLPCRYQAVM